VGTGHYVWGAAFWGNAAPHTHVSGRHPVWGHMVGTRGERAAAAAARQPGSAPSTSRRTARGPSPNSSTWSSARWPRPGAAHHAGPAARTGARTGTPRQQSRLLALAADHSGNYELYLDALPHLDMDLAAPLLLANTEQALTLVQAMTGHVQGDGTG